MGIPESQLETWSQLGKTKQFTDTYDSISTNLMDESAPYPVKDCKMFLQGSYGNNTNVFNDSDVDIVLRHDGAFYYDISGMSEAEQNAFKAVFKDNAEYGYPQFKRDAEAFIARLYNDTKPKKAVHVPGNSNRRDADVLVCQQFRRYYSYEPGGHGCHYGIAFYVDGKRIENFPKQHSDNCTEKHKATGNFKHMVRIFKNMRNQMIDDKLLAEGVAPSYFIEGMLSNVPNDKFKGTYGEAWAECFNWIVTTDQTKLETASGLHYLIRDGHSICWPSANFNTFMGALKKYWEA